MQLDLGKYQEQFHFMATHGLRPGEAAALTPEDIYRDFDGYWRVRINKTHGSNSTKCRYAREMPLLIDAPPSFKSWARDPDTLARHLKPFGLTPHSLRKTAASWLFRQGVDLKTVMTWCGWKDPKIALQIYAEVMSFQEEETAQGLRLDLRKGM
jgi:integrase